MNVEDTKSDSSLAPIAADLKHQDRSIFEAFSDYLRNFFPDLFAQVAENDKGKETADTGEYEQIVMSTSDPDELNEPEYFEEEIERIFKRNGQVNVSWEFLMKVFRQPLAVFRSPGTVIYKPSKTYDRILFKLIHLEDNGDFEEFDRYSSWAIRHYGNTDQPNLSKHDPDIVAAVTVEQGLCMIYRNELKMAKKFVKRGLELAEYTRVPRMFRARAYTNLSTIYQRKKKLGRAKRYLELAKENFENCWNYEDMSHFHESYGSYFDSFLGTLPAPENDIKEHALSSFRNMSEVASRDSRPEVRDKKRFYALIDSSRILLDSNSSFGRQQRSVSNDSVALAAKYLSFIKTELCMNIPRGSQIQLRLVESDLYLRQGKFEDEKSLLMECLQEAREYGFKTEEPLILNRIKEIEQIQVDTVSTVDKDNGSGNNYALAGSISSKESASADPSDSASDVFTSKYL